VQAEDVIIYKTGKSFSRRSEKVLITLCLGDAIENSYRCINVYVFSLQSYLA
jgi:hypothetical protein